MTNSGSDLTETKFIKHGLFNDHIASFLIHSVVILNTQKQQTRKPRDLHPQSAQKHEVNLKKTAKHACRRAEKPIHNETAFIKYATHTPEIELEKQF